MRLSHSRQGIAKVAINVRTGPNVIFDSIDVIARGTQVMVQEYEADAIGTLWFKYNDGWISGTYLDMTMVSKETLSDDDKLALNLHEDTISYSGSSTVDTSAGLNYVSAGDAITISGSSSTPNSSTNNKNGANWSSLLGGVASNISSGLFGGALSSVLGSDQSTILNQRLFGAPFQFIASTDIRPTTSSSSVPQSLGVAYCENILEEAPVINLLAGVPDYMPDATPDQRTKTISTLWDAVTGGVEMAQKALADQSSIDGLDTRFFEFKDANSDYMLYVNTMCRSLAIFMGLGDSTVPGTNETYSTYNWANYTMLNTFGNSSSNGGTSITNGVSVIDSIKNSVSTLFGSGDSKSKSLVSDSQASSIAGTNWGTWHTNIGAGKIANTGESEADKSDSNSPISDFINWSSAAISKKQSYVSFYIKPPSYSEAFTNSTQASTFKDTMKGISQSTKELAFVLQAAGANPTSIKEAGAAVGESAAKLGAIAAGNSTLSTIWKRLIRGSSTVLTGGNLIFPDIWTESGYERSFNIDIHLATPYGTPESIFLEILVPMAHIMGFCLPRQSDGGVNAYTSPFMVRANAPGFFTCDMGMVRSCQIQKGGNGDGWSYMGFPTEMDISLSIVDLYNTMAMASMDSVKNIYNFIWNTQFVDWLATNSGAVDMTTPFLKKKQELITTLVKNVPGDIWTNSKMRFREALRRTKIGIFGG